MCRVSFDNLTSSTKFLSAESVSGEPPWAMAGARGDLALLLLEDVPVGCTKGWNPDGTWWNCRTGHLLGAWNTLLIFVKAAYTENTWAWCNLLRSRLVSMQVGCGQHRTTLGAWKHSMDHYQLIYMTIMTWTQTLCQLENWQQLAATKFAAPGAHFRLAGAWHPLFVRCERIWKAWQPLAKCSASCRALSRSSCRHFHYAGLSAGGVWNRLCHLSFVSVISRCFMLFHVISCHFMSFVPCVGVSLCSLILFEHVHFICWGLRAWVSKHRYCKFRIDVASARGWTCGALPGFTICWPFALPHELWLVNTHG